MTRYGITGVFGNRENGKTTFMVWYILHVLAKGTYNRVHSNIHVKGDRRVLPVTLKELKTMKAPAPGGVPTELLALDQLHLYFDSRASMTKANREFSQIVIESRQHGFDIIYNTWSRSSVDMRLRRFTELNILAQRYGDGFHYTYIDPEKSGTWEQIMPWSVARQVWERFDTTELVQVG